MARKSKPYQLSRLAEADLESIYNYTLETWSKRQAEKYYKDLVDGFKSLAAGRKIGRPSEIGEGILKITVGSHVIFYVETENSIDVIRILHQAMDVARRIKP
jgi:toxin ParE1/3/4